MPIKLSDAELRRAQALAHDSAAALRIVRELIGQKLAGQEWVAREILRNVNAAQTIAQLRESDADSANIEMVAQLDASGASEYWSA